MAIQPWEEVGEPIVMAEGWGKRLLKRFFQNPRDGKVDDYYHFDLKSGGGVVVIIVTREGEVRMVREFMQGINKIHLWAGGGLRNAGEASEVAAHREVGEESGYRIGRLISLGPLPFVPRHCTTYTELFLALDCEKVGEQTLDPGEDIEIVPMMIDELIGAVQRGEINDPFTTAALMRALPHLGYSIVKS